MAGRQLESAGANVNIVDLTEHPDLLEALKVRLGRDVIQVPLFIDDNDEVFDITGLPDLLARAKAA